MSRMALFSLLSALALPASAQIYQYTDAKGNTVFTDQAPVDTPVKPIKLPPLNSLPVQPRPLLPEQAPPEEKSRPVYEVLQVIGVPTDGEALRANNGNFAVSVLIDPPLKNRHRLRLLLDGVPYGEPGRQPLFQLVNIHRGEHSLAVEVLNGDTRVQQSEAARFTLLRRHK